MGINFGPEFLHNVLLASVYERKLCTRFLWLASYLFDIRDWL